MGSVPCVRVIVDRGSPPPRSLGVSGMPTKWANVETIGSYFESLSDPRHVRNRKHLLTDVIVIAVCALVCGCDGPTAIHRWATQRHDWLRPFLTLANGLPSRDCIRRVLSRSNRRPSRSAFRTGSGTPSRPTPGPRPGSSPSTARRVAGPTTPARVWAPSTSSVPGRANRGSPWVRSPPTRSPTKSRRFPNSCGGSS